MDDLLGSLIKLKESVKTIFDGEPEPPPLQTRNLAPGTKKRAKESSLEEEWLLVDDAPAGRAGSQRHPKRSIDVRIERKRPKAPHVFPSLDVFDQTCDGNDHSHPDNADNPDNIAKFSTALNVSHIDLDALSELIWRKGTPLVYRAACWKMLLRYLPAWPHAHEEISKVKFELFKEYILEHVETGRISKKWLHPIQAELAITALKVPFFQSDEIQDVLEQASYICMREQIYEQTGEDEVPEFSFQEGLSQLTVPIFYTLFSAHHPDLKLPLDDGVKAELPKIEAELFWMTLRLFCQALRFHDAKPVELCKKVTELVKANALPLFEHLKGKRVDFMTITYEWSTSFLLPQIRKLPLIVLLWDRYIVAGDLFWEFHACVCARLIIQFEKEILELNDTERIIEFYANVGQSLQTWHFLKFTKFITSVCELAEKIGILQRVHEKWETEEKKRKEEFEKHKMKNQMNDEENPAKSPEAEDDPTLKIETKSNNSKLSEEN